MSTIELLFDPAAGRADPQGETVPGADGDDDTTVSFVDLLGGALAAAAIAIPPPPAQPAASGADGSGGNAGAKASGAVVGAVPAVIVPAPRVSVPELGAGAPANGTSAPAVNPAVPAGAAPGAAPEPELPFAVMTGRRSLDSGDAGATGAGPQITWTVPAARSPDAAATARWAPFRAPRAAAIAASHERAGAPLVAVGTGAAALVPPAAADGPVDPGALAVAAPETANLDPSASPSRRSAATALAHLAVPPASDAEPPASTPPTAAGQVAAVEAGPALPAGSTEPRAEDAGPPVHAVHLSARQGADAMAADAPARSDAAPASARAEESQPPGGELGQSGARITVGEGDDRVSLLIALRGEHVRVEARAHSAIYADVIHQRADELASGLADRGLVLGSLSADVSGERAGHSTPQQPDERSGRRSGEDRAPDPEPRPDRPPPRGVRAIA